MSEITRVDFDLDGAKRPVTYKPFVTSRKGHTLTMTDPAELDYRKLLEIETPLQFLKYTMSQEDRDFLASDEAEMESWRLNLLMEAYYRHFGLDKDRSKLGF